MSDDAIAEMDWEPDDGCPDGGWHLDIGAQAVMTLHVDNEDGEPGWCVRWGADEYEAGPCTTVEDGKRQALACAASIADFAVKAISAMQARLDPPTPAPERGA